jgi:hypothetical protein
VINGQLLWELWHESRYVNCVIWVHMTHGTYLMTGCGNGQVNLWSLNASSHPKQTRFRDFFIEIELMVYDEPSDQILITSDASLTICSLQETEVNSDKRFDCAQSIGGASFLKMGAECILSIPESQKMYVL